MNLEEKQDIWKNHFTKLTYEHGYKYFFKQCQNAQAFEKIEMFAGLKHIKPLIDNIGRLATGGGNDMIWAGIKRYESIIEKLIQEQTQEVHRQTETAKRAWANTELDEIRDKSILFKRELSTVIKAVDKELKAVRGFVR